MMSLLGLIYGSTIFPYNIYIHFRHLQTYKAKLELVLIIMRVINIHRAEIENIQKWKDKISLLQGYSKSLKYKGSTKEMSPPQSQGEAAARKAACSWSRALLPSPTPAKLRQRMNSRITDHKLPTQHLNLKT